MRGSHNSKTPDGRATLYRGDCLAVLPTLDAGSVDAVVTDPPYGLGFMRHAWDHAVPSVAVWQEVIRVLKPGGHMLCFAGTRTYHRMAVHVEDAGFEIRDMIAWLYGSGFPKSLDVSKAIEAPATDAARQWAMLEGFRFCGVEIDADYCELAWRRIKHAWDRYHGGPLLSPLGS